MGNGPQAGASPDHLNQTVQVEHLPPAVMYTCIAVILLSALASVVYLIFLAPLGHTLQYRVAVALLCFALSTVSCLLLSVRAQLSGQWGPYALFLAGPACMWIISLLVFSWVFPDRSTTVTVTVTKPTSDWKSYQEWLNQLDSVALVFKKTEEQEVPILLGNIYYPGDNHRKPSQPSVKMVVIYFPNGQAIAIKHMKGTKKGDKAEIYHRPLPTSLSAGLESLAFTKRGGRFEAVKDADAKVWHEVYYNEVDWYEITAYLEEASQADYLMFDTPKYVDTAEEGAVVDLGFLSARRIAKGNIRLWEVRPSPVADSSQVPLLFKGLVDKSLSNGDQIRADIAPFLQWLQERSTQSSSDEKEGRFFSRAGEILRQIPELKGDMTKLFSSQAFSKGMYFFQLRELKNSIILTYQWN